MDTTEIEQLAGFSPVITAESAKEVTLGRKKENDADKSNYFE